MFALLEHLLNLVYPRLCVCCSRTLVKNESHICTACDYELPKNNFQDDMQNLAAQLFWGRIMIENTVALYQYRKDSSVQKIIHHIKYKGAKELGIEMGQRLGTEYKKAGFPHPDMIVPIPLHKKKLLKRGYNQSELIATGISMSLNIPIATKCITRIVHSKTQTNKSRYDRWKNVEKIFNIAQPEVICNKHILLVDDVVTTGSTIESCATEILNVPGTTISLAALAVAVNG